MNKLLLILIILMCTNCATNKSNQKIISSIDLTAINDETTNFFLIGDTGKLENNKTSSTLIAMQKNFSLADKKDVLLFLGDHIYPKGIPTKKNNKQKKAIKILNSQLDVAKKFPGKVYFIPGNHDWYYGLEGLKIQEKLVEASLGKNTFIPQNGCPIEKININENIVLLVVDSQWYITDWDKHPSINSQCDIKTREQFLAEFRNQIKKSRGKTTLVVTHHPMYSNGSHNGNYTFKSHIKPLPILGSVKNIIRTTSGANNTDMSNRFYNDLRKNLIAASQQNDNVIFISGHEHNLQFIQADNLTQIISGSGTKKSGTKPQNKDQFGAAINGYAILNIKENQSSDVQFFDASKNNLLFKKNIRSNSTKKQTKQYPKSFNDSILSSIFSKEETSKSQFYKFLWGERFREEYSKPIIAKTVNLDTLYGGLTPVRKGGGNQSRSLRLKDKEGRQYVMRALKKSAIQYIQAVLFGDQYIQGQFENTETESFVSDFFTGSHPYAPLTVAALSEASNIYYLNPQLYYIPKQEALKEFNNEFGDELYFLEEHASVGHTIFEKENFDHEIISTMDLFKEIHKDGDISIDQEHYIRSRLFDMLIGDWDRHQDQWRWLKFKENNKTVYRALPRDRDQAYSKMSDGFLMNTAIAISPETRLLRKYSPDLKDVKGVNIEPYPLDNAFLQDADKSVWESQALFIQQNVTDKVIEDAFAHLPKEMEKKSVNELIELVKQRRANLLSIADDYYKYLVKYPIITCTNKDDYVSIKSLKNDKLEITISRRKGDKIKDTYQHKIYDPKETKEIWIYGLDGEDIFDIAHKVNKIKIRLIGGPNKDEYLINDGKNIVVYDFKSKKNKLDETKNAKVKLSDDYDTHLYNFRKKKSSAYSLVPFLGYNPDDGFKLGVTNKFTNNGFERNPFTEHHEIKAAYYFNTNGYEVIYDGEIANVIKNINLKIDAKFQSPNYTYNYFGSGNETINNDQELGNDYNRIKVRSVLFSPALVWNSERKGKLSVGVQYESIELDKDKDRIVANLPIPNYLFEGIHYVGTQACYTYKNYDSKYYPTNAILFSINTGYTTSINIHKKRYAYFIPNLSLVNKLNKSGNLTLATKFKGHINIGNRFEFYQAAAIGGDNGLRGYRNQRFTGKSSYVQNSDIRYSFNYIKTSFVPIKLGLFGSFDYGRVWEPNENSKIWHTSYGGGIFVNGAELISSKLGVFNSVDGLRVSFGLGFGF